MKRKVLYGVWIYMYLMCSILGHISQPSAPGRVWMTLAAVLFFVAPGILLADAIIHENRKGVGLIRWISVGSLTLTLAALIANIAVVNAATLVGNILHAVLIWVSTPMICSGYWALSLFLWACLLCASFLKSPKRPQDQM